MDYNIMHKENKNSFIGLLGIDIKPSKDNKFKSTGFIKMEEHHSQVYNVAHGGVVYSLADTVAGYVVWKNIQPEHERIVTIEMKINYVAACPLNGFAKAIGTLKHIGKRTAVVGVDVFHSQSDTVHDHLENEKLIATGIATFQILRQEK